MYLCQRELNVHVGTKDARQSPTMPAGIAINIVSNTPVMVGAIIRRGRAGRREDMVARGKLSGNVFSSAINISVRTIVGRTLRRKLPVLTTSYLKLMVALMMIPIWNRCAGNAIGPRQPERD